MKKTFPDRPLLRPIRGFAFESHHIWEVATSFSRDGKRASVVVGFRVFLPTCQPVREPP